MVQFTSRDLARIRPAVQPRPVRPILELISVSLEVPTGKGSDAAIANNQGVELSTKGEFSAALERYNEAVRLNPRLPEAYNNRANAYVRLGSLDDALASYREAAALSPNTSLYHYNFSSALLDKGDFEGAREQSQIAISAGPRHANAFLNLGLALAGLERHSEAIEAYDQAIQLDRDNVSALAGRGIALSELGQYEEALRTLERAAARLRLTGRADDPAYAQVYQYLAGALANTGRLQEALNVAIEVANRIPSEAGPHYTRGAIWDELGNYEQGLEAYEAAVRLAPDFPEALGGQGADLVRLGRFAEAIDPLQKALRLEPNQAASHYYLGLAYKNLNRFADAVASFRESLRLGIDIAEAHAELGYALFQTGDFDASLDAYAEAGKRDPNDPMIPENLGFIFAMVGRYREAIVAFRRALSLNPDMKKSRAGLCKALIDLGEFTSAAIELNEIQGIQSTNVVSTESIDTLGRYSQPDLPVTGPQKEGDAIFTDDGVALTELVTLDPTRLADDLFQRQQEHSAPVNVAAIALASNVGVSIASFDDGNRTASRLVRLPDNRYHIYLASDLRTPWKRMFVAQQLYYALANASNPNASEDSALANAAQLFAAALLMPRALVSRYWPPLRDIEAMAAAFDVPRSAMEARLGELGLDQGSPEYEHGNDSIERSAGREGNLSDRPGPLAPQQPRGLGRLSKGQGNPPDLG